MKERNAYTRAQLARLIAPQSVAIVGVSPRANSFATAVLAVNTGLCSSCPELGGDPCDAILPRASIDCMKAAITAASDAAVGRRHQRSDQHAQRRPGLLQRVRHDGVPDVVAGRRPRTCPST